MNHYMIEGEPLLYDGKLWFVKGYQHPPGYVVAFPRYSLTSLNTISGWTPRLYYWDCIKAEVPVVELSKAYPFQSRINGVKRTVLEIMVDYMGLSSGEVFITGSSLLGLNHDLDIVIRGFREEYISTLDRLLSEGLIRRVNDYVLYREYLEKHVGDTDLYTYLYIKRNTYLHIMIDDVHVNLKFTRYRSGYSGCRDPVYNRRFFYGEVRVLKPIHKYVVPSKYLVETGAGSAYMESFREIYSELPNGRYYVEGFVETRRDGEYIVPDHGWVKYIGL